MNNNSNNNGNNDTTCNKERLVPTTVRLPESVYNRFSDLAKKSNSKLSSIIRHTLEFSLEKYLKRVGYSDDEKTAELLGAVRELSNICGDIFNEVHRIGINYNQEIRLKNAQKKYNDILNDRIKTTDEKQAAINEYNSEIADIKENGISKDEFKTILERFEAGVEEVRSFAWHIHQ